MTTPKKTATQAKAKPKSGAKVVPIRAAVPSSTSSSASAVAADIRARPYGYDRAKLAAFQRQSGIAADGLYGPASRAALQRAGIANPPPISFKGASAKQQPPPSSSSPLTWLLLGGAAWLLLRK